jgi:sulfide:quinone oxidoreductase
LSGQTVIILGAGTGGLVCANRLRRMLGKEHRIVLIDRSAHYTFEPSLAWVMTGDRTVPRITRDLRTLERRGIEFVAAEVTAIDTASRRVHTANRSLLYDHLVLALGAEYTSEDVPGLKCLAAGYAPAEARPALAGPRLYAGGNANGGNRSRLLSHPADIG